MIQIHSSSLYTVFFWDFAFIVKDHRQEAMWERERGAESEMYLEPRLRLMPEAQPRHVSVHYPQGYWLQQQALYYIL